MRTIITLFSLFVALFASAQTVSVDEAMARAQRFLNGNGAKVKSIAPGKNTLELAYTDKADGSPTYYVFNQSSDNGFVIVGGDEAAVEILGHSERGRFDYSQIPSNMRAWLNSCSRSIGHSISMVKSGKVSILPSASLTRTMRMDVYPLCSTEWDQDEPYNWMVAGGQSPYYTGCVATAAAQVMKYYEHPETGMPVTYGSETLGRINNQTYVAPEVNLDMTYRWDKMRNKYEKNGYTSDEGVAVAELMYAVGRACKMQYGTQASSAYTSDLASALGNYFKYDKSLEYAVRSYYSDEEWEDKIYNCLSLSRPVIYGAMADDDSGGHCFIIDGYDSSEEKYHVNWGWGGYCDGLFVITGTRSLLPTGSGSGGASEGAAYSVGHEAIVNLFPDEGGESVIRMYSDRYTLIDRNGLGISSVEAGNYVYLTHIIKSDMVVCNLSNNAVNSEIGVKFRNTGSGMVEYVSAIDANHKLAVYTGYSSIPVCVPFSLAGGTYELTVVYKDNSGNWVEAKKCPSQEPCILTVGTRNDKILPTMPLRLPSENTLQKDNHEIVYSLRNTTNGALNGVRAMLFVFPGSGGNYSFYYEKVLNFAAGEEKRLTFTPDDISDEYKNSANYYVEGKGYLMIPVCIIPGGTQYQYEQISLSCGATDTVKYVLDEDWSTICLPFDADVPEGMYAYSLTRTPGGEIEATSAGGKINMNIPYLVAGTKKTYTFVGPKTYSLELCGGGILRGSTWENGAKVPRYGFMLQKVGNEYKFVRVDTYDKMITQYHAYVALDDAQAHEELSIPLSATVVETVAGERMQPVGEADAFYNVSGQRVDEASKGIVVSRGKKVLRK